MSKLMHLSLILSLFISRTQSILHTPSVVKIDDCEGSETESGTAVSDNIKAVAVSSKNKLGTTKEDVNIIAVESTGATISKSDLCRNDGTVSPSTTEYYHIKSASIKSIIYKVGSDHKMLIIGATLSEIIQPYMVQEAEKTAKFSHVEFVKCFPASELTNFKNQFKKSPKPYVESTDKLCFVSVLMNEQITVNGAPTSSGSTSSSEYSLIVSPYPKLKCPTCPDVGSSCK